MNQLGRVALIGENSVEYINALIDIWNNDDCAVLLDWRIPFETAFEIMKEADVEKCYIEVGLYPEICDEEVKIAMLKLSKKNKAAVGVVKLLACSSACTGGSCPPPNQSKQYTNAGKK
jgi:hypothetical protein